MCSARIDGIIEATLVNTTQLLYHGTLEADTGLEKPPATHEPPSLLDRWQKGKEGA